MNSFGKSSKTKLASTKVFVRKAQQLLKKRQVKMILTLKTIVPNRY